MSLKVLIIEPNTVRQRQLKSLLGALGHRSADIEVAEDARTGQGLFRKKRYDCCFLALDLPEQGSLVLLEEMRNTIVTRSLPVIVIGAGVTKETVLAIMKAGACGFLALPLTLENVEGALAQALRQ